MLQRLIEIVGNIRHRFIRPDTIFNMKYIDEIEVDGVDTKDYPDLCDAYFSYATYRGKEMTDWQLGDFQEQQPDLLYETAYQSLF